MAEFVVLAALGVRVREVADLAEGALWLGRRRLLLVDPAAFSSEECEDLACDLLGRVSAEME